MGYRRPPGVHLDLIRREIPVMIFVALLGFGLIYTGEVSRLAGAGLFLALCVYTGFGIWMARREPGGPSGDVAAAASPVWLCLIQIVLGLAILVAGSHLFVSGAVDMAREFGVSEAVIGLTIVAAGTSLPELATSVVAAAKRQSDVAIGNIVGSNLFNILGILGLTAVVQPIEVGGVGIVDGLVMLGLSALLSPFAFSQQRISRGEGAVFLVIYGMYLYVLWP